MKAPSPDRVFDWAVTIAVSLIILGYAISVVTGMWS